MPNPYRMPSPPGEIDLEAAARTWRRKREYA
jgi:hypothetical protein